MTDFYEAETNKGSMKGTQIEQFLELLDPVNIPIYMSLGNHDIASYWVDSTSSHYSTNQLHAMQARSKWVRNADCFKNGTYYSRTYQVDTTTYRLIFLDNGYYSPDRKEKNNKDLPPNIVDKYQLLWLSKQLKRSKKDVVLIFTHIPVFPPHEDEIRDSKNTYHLDLSDTIPPVHSYEETFKSDKDQNLKRIIKDYASDHTVIFSGHKHSTAFYKVQITDDFLIPQVLTGAFGRDSRNWRLIKLTSDSILISYPGVDAVQYSIPID
jgi:DNA repair exonuclease SbcCD nuclease subunit